MRIFKFIKWKWQQADNFIRVLYCYLVWALVWGISIIWLGTIGVAIMAAGLPAIFLIEILISLFNLLKEEWKEFNEVVPTDDIAIVQKLKGTYRGPRPKPPL